MDRRGKPDRHGRRGHDRSRDRIGAAVCDDDVGRCGCVRRTLGEEAPEPRQVLGEILAGELVGLDRATGGVAVPPQVRSDRAPGSRSTLPCRDRRGFASADPRLSRRCRRARAQGRAAETGPPHIQLPGRVRDAAWLASVSHLAAGREVRANRHVPSAQERDRGM